MKFLKKTAIGLFTVCALLLGMTQTCLAAGISVSAGQSTVSVGKTVAFTITVPSNADVWLYNVEYSSNLTLESGKVTMVEGYSFDAGTRVNQLVFRAKSTGTATVRISSGSYAINGKNYDAVGSASVTVIAANKPDSGEHKPSGDTRSANNALASLTVSAGELTPAFDPSVTDYTLSLPLNSDKLTLTAAPSDSKAKVQGDGEVALQGGVNTLSVLVTAENGDVRTYTITVKVAQVPTLFFDFAGQKLGVVKDVEEVTPPAGFTAAEPISHGGDLLPVWTDASGEKTLVYLVDESAVTGFYLYSETGGVLSPYLPLADGALPYVYTGLPAGASAPAGLAACTVDAFGRAINGWKYNDPALQGFYVLYLMDADGIYGYYTYDSAKDTLQRFNGAVFTDDGGESLRVPMLYVYIAGGAAAVLLILVIVLACVSGSRGKKLRLLPDVSEAKPAAPEAPAEPASDNAPAEQPEAPVESAPSEPQTPEETAEEPAPAQEAEASQPAQEPEAAPEPEAAQPQPPSAEAEPVPDSAPTEPAPQPAPEEAPAPAEPAPQPPADKPEPSLEDTLRRLPLDELLRDIHDL